MVQHSKVIVTPLHLQLIHFTLHMKDRDKAFNKKNACSSISGGTDSLSSIVCRTAVAEDVSSVPVRVLIDTFPVTTTKMFYYKINPVITGVQPQCSVQRLVDLISDPFD